MSVFYDLNKTPRNILNQAIVRAIVSENNGAWFDPSDMSTLYRDAAGTTPVTAVEQPVGLMLDKSRGLMLGPELVSNGTFDSDINGWTQGNSITTTWVNGTASMARSGVVDGSLAFRQSVPVTQGKIYKVSFTSSGNSVARQITGCTPSVGPAAAGIGIFSFILTAATTSFLLNFWPTNDGTTASVDNISVREIYGNHATQSVTASRPVLSARKNVLLATETLATQSVTSIAAQYTLSFTGAGIVTLSGTATDTLTGTGVNDRVSLTVTPTAGTLTLTVSGSVTKAQLELGTSAGPYQRVNTATDYDTNPALFPKYLKFDGVDDYLSLPYMGLYANGSASGVYAITNLQQTQNSALISERDTASIQSVYIPRWSQSGSNILDTYIRNKAGTVLLDSAGVVDSIRDLRIESFVDTGINFNTFKNSVITGSSTYSRSGSLTLVNTTIGAYVSTTTTAFLSHNNYGLIITKSALSDTDRRRCEQFLASRLTTLGVTLS